MAIFGIGEKKDSMPPMPPPSYPEQQGMYAAWEQEDMTGVAGIALDNSGLLIQIRAFLSGQELVERTDPKTGRKVSSWEQVAQNKMNDKGVRSVVMHLRAYLDKNLIMSYWPTHDDIKKFMVDFSVDIIFFLGQNMEEFEIRTGHESDVSSFIINNVYITCLRSLQGNEKKGIYKQLRRIEHDHSQAYGQVKKNLFAQ